MGTKSVWAYHKTPAVTRLTVRLRLLGLVDLEEFLADPASGADQLMEPSERPRLLLFTLRLLTWLKMNRQTRLERRGDPVKEWVRMIKSQSVEL